MSRLIDADRMKKVPEIQMANFNSIEGVREWVDRQPTIEAVPVVYGEWIFDKYTAKFGKPYRCSNCNEEFGDTYSFCPNCWSRMNSGTQNSSRNRIIDEFAQKAIERLEDMGCEAWQRDILAIAEEKNGGRMMILDL